MEETTIRKYVLEGVNPIDFFGTNDRYLKLINSLTDASVTARGELLILKGTEESLDEAESLLDSLVRSLRNGRGVSEQQIRYFSNMVKGKKGRKPIEITVEPIYPGAGGKPVFPRTVLQETYIKAIRNHDVVVCIGPAGTGKTYLAVASALSFLHKGSVGKIVLVRPAVEAGESLGYLPGDISEKVDPYMRPLLDALTSIIRLERVNRLVETGIIEIVPLAYMRGRTLNRSFVILDEGQNATRMQMKMFLTRLGAGSRAVITGDVTQIDLPENSASGLVHVQSVLASVQGIEFVYFTEHDVVRHNLVQNIIKAYEKYEAMENGDAAQAGESEKQQ